MLRLNFLNRLTLSWLCLAFLAGVFSAQAKPEEATIFLAPDENGMVKGTTGHMHLSVLNKTRKEISWTFPALIKGQIVEVARNVTTPVELSFSGDSADATVPAGAFVQGAYSFNVPQVDAGEVILEITSIKLPRVLVPLKPAAAEQAPAVRKNTFVNRMKYAEPDQPGEPFNPARFFKEHLFAYEPFYFIAGTESPNAKFQISIKYQLLKNNGHLAERVPELRGFYAAYTQTSLWDWNKASAPFFDSSYKPELMYRMEKIFGGAPTNWFRFDAQVGVQHESNGRDGESSRSMNIAYLRPTFIFGKGDNFQVSITPRAWIYMGDLSDNPDITRYRGYADLRGSIGWPRGLQLAALGRMGHTGEHGSVQLDLTYPTMQIWDSFSVYLHAQYFTGYGESLLEYNQRSSAFRIGFSLFR